VIPFQMLLVALLGRLEREQRDAIAFLRRGESRLESTTGRTPAA
jgi:hypothetical protein